MTVKDLRQLLEGVDDNIKVIIPNNPEFDGVFYSPCSISSGITQVGTGPELSIDDIKEMELLGKELPEEDAFMLIPCGFGEELDHSHELN